MNEDFDELTLELCIEIIFGADINLPTVISLIYF